MTENGKDRAGEGEKDEKKDRMSTTKAVSFVALIIGAIAGGLGLLFELEPNLKPCIGGPEVRFTGVPVFPSTPRHTHLEHTNTPREQIADEENDIGAEVRYSFKASGLRGDRLTVMYSLVRIERDESLGRVDPEQDRAAGVEHTSDTCSEVMGGDLFVTMPSTSKHRYRVVLEVYRGEDFDQRLAFTSTDIFSGRAADQPEPS